MEVCCSKCQGLFTSRASLAALTSFGGLEHHKLGSLNSSALRGCPICKMVEDSLPREHRGNADAPLFCQLFHHTTHRSPENIDDPHPWCDRQAEFGLYFTCPALSGQLATFFITVEAGACRLPSSPSLYVHDGVLTCHNNR